MNIGLIGAGNIGKNAARNFLAAGHAVALSNSRGPDTLQSLVDELGENVRAVTVEEAAAFGEVVMEAIPYRHVDTLPAEALEGTILISAANYFPHRDGEIDFGDGTHTERVAELVPGARVVKAFNTIYFEHLRTQGDPDAPVDERRVIPLAGDDADAKSVVAGLIEDIGFAPLDLGSLRDGGRLMQPGQPIYNETLTREEAKARV
jgi:predicted dinucleotide-binding enzyme